jgi:hypothetical protein
MDADEQWTITGPPYSIKTASHWLQQCFKAASILASEIAAEPVLLSMKSGGSLGFQIARFVILLRPAEASCCKLSRCNSQV